MADRPFNVLFLCTGNSARSILAEAILNKIGAVKFQAFSAGSQPKGQVHPETLRLLQSLGFDVVVDDLWKFTHFRATKTERQPRPDLQLQF